MIRCSTARKASSAPRSSPRPAASGWSPNSSPSIEGGELPWQLQGVDLADQPIRRALSNPIYIDQVAEPMLIGNAPCSWGITYPTGNAYTWQQYLDEVAAAGYRGTELGPVRLPAQGPGACSRMSSRSATCVMIGATHVHTFGDRCLGARC